MPGIKEAKGFFYSLLIVGILVLIASLYSSVWAAPSQGVSGQTVPTLPTATVTPTPTVTSTPTPVPTATITPAPTMTPTPTAIPVITPSPTVVPPSAQLNVVVAVQTGATTTGAVVTKEAGKQEI